MLEYVHAMAQSVRTNLGAPRVLRLSPRVWGDMGLRVKGLVCSDQPWRRQGALAVAV